MTKAFTCLAIFAFATISTLLLSTQSFQKPYLVDSIELNNDSKKVNFTSASEYSKAAKHLKEVDSHCFSFTQTLLSDFNRLKPQNTIRKLVINDGWNLNVQINHRSDTKNCEFKIDLIKNNESFQAITSSVRLGDIYANEVLAMKLQSFLSPKIESPVKIQATISHEE